MAVIIDGKKLALEIRERLGREVSELKRKFERAPGLAVVQVGEDPASTVYVSSKIKACKEAGIESFGHILPDATTEEELLALVDQLNNDPAVDGILVQLPLPPQIDENAVICAISPQKDVDGFHPLNAGYLSVGKPALVACTPLGCIEMLRSVDTKFKGKKAVMIGRSNIVGKPVAQLLLKENCTVTIAHRYTEGLPEICQEADIIVVAIGQPLFIDDKYVKEGQTIIDVGINRTKEGKIVGDVDFEKVAPIVRAISPVPGGVGPMTIAMLLQNTVTAYCRRMDLQ